MAELRATGPVVDNLHVTRHARYNRPADHADIPDTSFVHDGVKLRYPF